MKNKNERKKKENIRFWMGERCVKKIYLFFFYLKNFILGTCTYTSRRLLMIETMESKNDEKKREKDGNGKKIKNLGCNLIELAWQRLMLELH